MKIISTNKKAFHNFFIEHTLQAGIVLIGSEVKSVRAGHVNLNDAYISISKNAEVFVKNMYIKPYEKSTVFTPNDRKPRKLLLNKSEIKKLQSKVREKGYTIVPLKIYFENQLVKLDIALAKGKHLYDKKQTLAEKDIKLDMQRQIKNYSRLK